MIENYHLAQNTINLYMMMNASFCIVSGFWIVSIFVTRRHLFIKPSVVLLTLSHVFFQWPLTFYSSYYETFLKDAYTFALIVHGFILCGLLIAGFTFDRSAKAIWHRITAPEYIDNAVSTGAALFLASIALCVIIYYLYCVPFTSTGLYAIFMNPEEAGMAREKSLKLLESNFLKYSYSFVTSSVAPLLAAMLGIFLFADFAKGNVLRAPIYLSLLLLLAVAVSMTGARISVVNLLMVVIIALLYHQGIPLKPMRFLILLVLLLLFPALLSMLREGRSVGLAVIPEYYGHILRRIFVTPLDVGSWYIHFSQTNGFLGIAAVPKLAWMLGLEPIIAPNLIGLAYTNSTVQSTTAGASYIFSYYSYFGLLSLGLIMGGLWLLDIAMFIYGALSDALLLPCIAAVSLSTVAFISSDYTVAWVTHGFGVVLLISWLVDKWIIPPSRRLNMTESAVSRGKDD
jgi:hypothetical protein